MLQWKVYFLSLNLGGMGLKWDGDGTADGARV